MPSFTPSAATTRVERHSLRVPMGSPPPDVVSLAMGEPDFVTPEPIVDAAITALKDGATHYVHQHGDPELRNALAKTVTSVAGEPFHEDQVLVTHGASAALAAAILAIVDPGDKVVIPEPGYSLYGDLVQLAGGTPVFVPAAADLHWDVDAIRTALAGAKLIVFSNPCNPTGIVHSKDELIAALQESDALVLSDEAYSAIVYTEGAFHSTLAIDELRARTIYCQTLSKTYAMTGWRLGYLAGPADVIAAAARIHRTFNGSLNAAVQRAALAALDAPQLTEPMLAAYRDRRDVLFERLADVPSLSAPLPDGTFYAFARYEQSIGSVDLTARLREAGVLVRPGAEYGPSGEGHIRFSFAADIPTLHEGIDRVARCFKDLFAR